MAVAKAETPAHIATVEFKELGDTKRGEVMARIIQATWGETCKPMSLQLAGYSGNGSSDWTVHCSGSTMMRDYLVALPERSSANARVLKCFGTNPRISVCNIIGRNAT